ncbi:hypothetical protein MF625_001005 [Paenibacillus polymyxa]|uniref:hypothetical protein n=1 Tax=Paenibacillus polymyxa TaxID=1406 RepID=UPI0020246FFD|nr:hypothetical protein [Paenibacillus polymyxa]URJ36587.3 hypothetical protein MF625_001005 [Paenibacillus polymyxa]
MEYITTIEVSLKTGKTTDNHKFENEKVTINRASYLWFKNNSDSESDFIETVKLWHRMDKGTGETTFYNFKTSEPTPVVPGTTYRVESISEEDQSIMFKEV